MRAFERAAELVDVAEHGGGPIGVPAKINRILNIGAVARVQLTALNGAGATLEPQFFEVELSPERLLEINLAAGLPVRLVSSRLCIFERGARS